jgi:uncharacterized ParB-like nuclease family protein
MSDSSSFTNLTGPIINNNYESVVHDAVAMCGWKSEEAEMPSDEVVAPSTCDELYFYRYEGCQRLEGYALECQRKYVSHLIFSSPIF